MKRGDIWLINLDPTIGSEISKTRPAILISHNDLGILPLKIVVPITEWKEHFQVAQWMTKIIPDEINGLEKISSADSLQVRSVSLDRFVRKIGEIDDDTLNRIEDALIQVLDL